MPVSASTIPKYCKNDVCFHSAKNTNPIIIDVTTSNVFAVADAIDKPVREAILPKLMKTVGEIIISNQSHGVNVVSFFAQIVAIVSALEAKKTLPIISTQTSQLFINKALTLRKTNVFVKLYFVVYIHPPMPLATKASHSRQPLVAQFQVLAKSSIVKVALQKEKLEQESPNQFTKGERLHSDQIIAQCRLFANFLKDRSAKLIRILTRYETHHVAHDEIRRCLDLFRNIHENEVYFTQRVGEVTTFLPRNQPLYAFSCFSLVPSLMASEVHVRPPVAMRAFFKDMIDCLEIQSWFPNIFVSFEDREEFVCKRAAIQKNTFGESVPVTDCVIFTGTMENADEMRKRFSTKTLFISNGAGHNPIVIGPDANISAAVESAMRVQLYNQGQDCANPNSILVHKDIFDGFLKILKEKLKRVHIGPYENEENLVGPLTEAKDLKRIQSLFVDNHQYIDAETPGIIRTKERLVEPTLIIKPLSAGANYIEQFAPVFFIQKYHDDSELSDYFENPQYERNAMYVTLFGNSEYVNALIGKTFPSGRILHDSNTLIFNTDLHAEGVERGTQPYGGYGRGASCISLNGVIECKPTCPQRDIFELLIQGKMRRNEQARDKKSVRKTIEKAGEIINLSEYKSINQLYSKLKRFAGNFQIDIGSDEIGRGTYLRNLAIAHSVASKIGGTPFIYWHDMEDAKELMNGQNDIPLCLLSDPLKEFESLFSRKKFEVETLLGNQNLLSSGVEESKVKNSELIRNWCIKVDEFKEVIDAILRVNYGHTDPLIKIRSRFTGKLNTRVIKISHEQITYHCLDTSQLDTVTYEESGLFDFALELKMVFSWLSLKPTVIFETSKSKWAMAYKFAAQIAKEVFSFEPPILVVVPYSTIKTANERIGYLRIDDILEPGFLTWFFESQTIDKKITLVINASIFNDYDKFDQIDGCKLSMSQSVFYGQCANWNFNLVKDFLKETNVEIDEKKLRRRLMAARAWLSLNPEMEFNLLQSPNFSYFNRLTESDKENIAKLKNAISKQGTLQELEKLLYDIPKIKQASESEQKIAQRIFFTHIYHLLLGSPRGPRLVSLLYLANKSQLINLLSNSQK